MSDEHEECYVCKQLRYLLREKIEKEVGTRAADDEHHVESMLDLMLERLTYISELEDRVETLEMQVRHLQGYDPMDE